MKYQAGTRRRAAEYEKAIAEWWKKNKIFEKSVEQRSASDAYVFYDGPPFITGDPHYGNLLSSILKDAVPRYWAMKGKRCERRWGWDCHGLPAENFVEKQLGITDRREIGTKVSLEHYITKARESMVANSESWEGIVERVGRWVDFRGAYRTMDKDFMESVWWAFKTLYEAGKIYEGRRVLMYDTKFATPVSKSEVTMDNDAYQVVTDPSAYVKFALSPAFSASADALLTHRTTSTPRSATPASLNKLDDKANLPIYFLAWTTTPWTLPANMCLAVNPEMEYGLYEVGEERFIVASTLADRVLIDQKLGTTGEAGTREQRVLRTFKGSELLGMEYEPLISGVLTGEKKKDTYTVVAGDFVSDEDGTGIVHCAPAYGETDYSLMDKYELDLVDCIDENGYYLPEMAEKLHELGVRDTDEGGIEMWAANKFIAKCLEAAGTVYKIEYIKHEYPFNPRSKQRIMYRAFPSWFFDTQGSKALMLEQNENIHWSPEYFKHGRFEKNIEQAPDWNLSRDRFWATAMPVWKGDKGSIRVVGSYDELYELSGVRLEDYHRPWVDEVEFDIDGEHFTRIDKVLDCWFESGSMPFAQLHYPFEDKEKFEANYPADYIAEYVGQIRAWFYYIHQVNVSLAEIGAFDSGSSATKNAFKNVIVTGTLAGNDGTKMSKSRGNYTDPNELMDRFSADSLRLTLLSSPVCMGEDFALIDKDVSDTARKISMIWNVYDFFTTYAAVDNVSSEDCVNRLNETGLSASSSGQGADGCGHPTPTARGATASPSAGAAESASSPVSSSALSNPLDLWVISRVHQLRDQITAGMEAYDLPKATAGILPFVDDLSNWFVRRSRRRFWKSEDDGDKAEAYATLYYVLVYLAEILAPFVPFLAEELYQQMVGRDKSVHLLDWPEAGMIDKEVVAQMARTREIITEGLALRMRKSDDEEQIKVRQPLMKLTYAGEKLPEVYEQMIADEVNVKVVECGEELTLDKTLTDELRAEGFARELVRVVQAARKKAGLQVDDRIRLKVSCELAPEQAELVKKETLAVELSGEGNYGYDEIAKVGGEEVVISLEKT